MLQVLGCRVEGKEAGRCVMMCMSVNKKGRYCVVNVVSVGIEELTRSNWWNKRFRTEVGVE